MNHHNAGMDLSIDGQGLRKPPGWVWRWVIAFSISLLTTSCSRAEPDYSGTTSMRLYRHSQEDVVTLKIPNGYLDYLVLAGPLVPGTKENLAPIQSTMYFIAETGTLAPRSKENAGAFEFPSSLTNKIRFKIGTFYGRFPADVPGALQNTYESLRSMFSHSCIKPLAPQTQFGLQRYTASVDNCPKQHGTRKNMFIERDVNGDVKTQIFCTNDEVPDLSEQIKTDRRVGDNPMCEHAYFFAPLNASVVINHPRFLLKDWQLLQERIDALLTSFMPTAKAR